MRGFTLLEVMISLAIMAAVILTVLGAVNYHIGVIANERDNTTLTLLARNILDEKKLMPAKGEGTFAPAHPELSWKVDLLPTDYPFLQKWVAKVRRVSDGREVALVWYSAKQ
jgi:general secretion pathway protein I